MNTLLALLLMTAANVAGTSTAPVPCKSVADCWLDADGKAIERPTRHKGQRLPAGNCDGNLLWLRHRLTCEQHVCVSVSVPDRC